MKLELKTAPSVQPITLAEAKAHLRVDTTDEDTYINTLITASTNFAEKYTYRQFITATYYQYLDSFPIGKITLEKPKLQSVTAITYTDEDGDTKSLSTDVYEVDDKATIGTIRLKDGQSYPTTKSTYNAVRIEFKAGYGDAGSDVPDLLKSTLKVMVSYLFENRNFATPQDKDLIFPSSILLLLDQFSLREFI